LLGVGVSDLTATSQLSLFEAPESARNRQLDATVDDVRERFGVAALRPASALGHTGSATQSTLGARVDLKPRPGSQKTGREALPRPAQEPPVPVEPNSPGTPKSSST